MFGTLLESRARRHRRTGGAALSIAAHTVIIGAATAATVHGTTSPRIVTKPEVLLFTVTRTAPKAVEHRTTARRPATASKTDLRPIVLTIPALNSLTPVL